MNKIKRKKAVQASKPVSKAGPSPKRARQRERRAKG